MPLQGRILITGGAGFLARAIYRRAEAEGWDAEFTALSRDDAKHAALQHRFPDVKTIRADVAGDYQLLVAAMRGHDIVIHAAAAKYVDRSEHAAFDTVRTNITGSEQVIHAAIEARVGKLIGISTDKACVDYHGRVELVDGSTRAIAELVRERSTATVRTVDGEGGLAASAISGWHKSKRAGRRMFAVSYEHGPRQARYARRAIVTEDHPVLTTCGWLPASEVDGVDLVTSEYAPNRLQERLLVGTVLGDSMMRSGRTGLTRYQAGNPDWNNATAAALHGLGASVRVDQRSGTVVGTKAAGWAARLRAIFYPMGKKIVPRELVSGTFSAEMLAAWYMDDGTLARGRGKARSLARFATHGFTESDVRWLADLFTERGLPATVQRIEWHGYGPYYELRLTADGSDRLFAEIGRLVVSSKRHKLPEWAPSYDPDAWTLGQSVPFIARGSSQEVEVAPRDVYCLDINDTHNFAVSGVVLHNCEPVNVYGMTKAVMERLLHEAAGHSGLTDVLCVRYGNVVGSTGSVIPLFAQQLAETRKIKLTDPAMTRFWMSVEEAIDLIVWTLDNGESGVMYVPDPGAMRMNALAYTVLGYTGLPDDLEGAILDERIEVIGKRPGEKMHEQLIHEQESPRAEIGARGQYIAVHPPGQSFGERTFTMRSDQPNHWLGPDNLRHMMALAEDV